MLVLALALALLVISIGFAMTALILDDRRFALFFSEAGPIENATLWGWVLLAGFSVVVLRRITRPSLSGMVLCLAAAAREADWHKEFTGYSVMKIGFYHDSARGVGERLLAFFIVAAVIASAVILVRSVLTRWRLSAEKPPTWGVVTVLAIGWLITTKIADRFRDIFNDLTGFEFSETAKNMLSAVEEGGELLLPLLFGVAVWVFARSHHDRRDASTTDGL